MGFLNESYETISKRHQRVDIGDFRDKVVLVRVGNMKYDAESYTMKPSEDTKYSVYGCYNPYGGGFITLEGQSTDGVVSSKLYLRQYPKDFDVTWRVIIGPTRFRIKRIANVDNRNKMLCLHLEQIGDNDNNMSKM